MDRLQYGKCRIKLFSSSFSENRPSGLFPTVSTDDVELNFRVPDSGIIKRPRKMDLFRNERAMDALSSNRKWDDSQHQQLASPFL
jgi:hypothetical protein